MKCGRVAGLDGIAAEILTKGEYGMVKKIYVFLSMYECCESAEYEGECIAPFYNGKEEKKKCSNYRGINY